MFLIDNAHPTLSENLHHAPIDVHTKTAATDQGEHLDLLDGSATRTLADGRSFEIVKRYFRPDQYQARMAELGWQVMAEETDNFFFWATAQRP